MLISESWLREWVSPKATAQELGERLTLSGSEMDSVNRAGPDLNNSKIVVGHILSVAPHSDATKLQICDVDVGKKKTLSIICGAPNARAGLKTAVATSGAKLPGLAVGNREIRGVKSFGMLCSNSELGIDESTEGIVEFDLNAPVGVGVADYLDLADSVIELELTPNRGDCLGISGIAREVSTLLGCKFNEPEVKKVRAQTKTTLSVVLKAPSACARYVGRAIENIDMSAKSPDWMIERLRRSGMRSINPIVDITNYVMHEFGQPMHAFDMSKIQGGIQVRMAKKGEKHKLLDGSTVKLDTKNLVIADHKKAIALAGIMGGDNSAISDKTQDIYLEAAFFAPDYMIGKARDFGMHTDASHRFERGVDYALQLKAMERATQLVLDIAGGKPGPISHAMDKKSLPSQRPINFDRAEIERTLGIRIPAKKTTRILEDLGMKLKSNKKGWKVLAPSWRFDIQEQYDLVEEVGRCYGYDHVPARMPASEQVLGAHQEKILSIDSIKNSLVDLGYHEAITYSFVDPVLHRTLTQRARPIKLMNPIADNMSVMRQSLWPGLLEALKTNLNRQESRVRLFEVGHVFNRAKNSRKSVEQNRLAGLIAGSRMPDQWSETNQAVDFFDLKGDLEAVIKLTGFSRQFNFESAENPALHPGQCAAIISNGKKIGYLGKLHPAHAKSLDLETDVFLFELNMASLSESKLPEFSEISKFPAVERDLSILISEGTSVDSISQVIKSTAGELLKKLELFDIYRGNNIEKNKKSLAFSLTFQSESSNLTSSEIDVSIANVISALKDTLNAQLRE